MPQQFQVRISGDHMCCGEEIELQALVRLRARRWGDPTELVEIRHPAERDWHMAVVEGRVIDVAACVGGSDEQVPITRLTSGRALRGFDPADDGLLLSVLDDEPLAEQVDEFVVTVLGSCVQDLPPDPRSQALTTGWW